MSRIDFGCHHMTSNVTRLGRRFTRRAVQIWQMTACNNQSVIATVGTVLEKPIEKGDGRDKSYRRGLLPGKREFWGWGGLCRRSKGSRHFSQPGINLLCVAVYFLQPCTLLVAFVTLNCKNSERENSVC